MTETTNIGRLRRIPVREVWAHEALDFTPWLLRNVDVLNDVLGMELELRVAEHPVGSFSLDLLGHDTDTQEPVIVENQLGPSDHGHLGQILTYAAGTDPGTIVWLATSFRDEHRAAIDWLNTRTDQRTRFFAVQVEAVRIGDSEPAPALTLIAQPNDWEKTVRRAAHGDLSDGQLRYQEFWRRWVAHAAAAGVPWRVSNRPTTASWFPATAGVDGATFSIGFMRRGLISELYFEHRDEALNDVRFADLRSRAEALEASYGGPIEWDPMPGRKSSRVCEYLPGARIDDDASWDEYLSWFLDRQLRLRAAVAAIGGVRG